MFGKALMEIRPHTGTHGIGIDIMARYITSRGLARRLHRTVPELHGKCRDKGECRGPGCQIGKALAIAQDAEAVRAAMRASYVHSLP